MRQLMGILGFLAVMTAVWVGGCGEQAFIEPPPGEVTLAMKDAPSDDIDVFEVDIVQITLVRATGTVVATLPATQRINFADLTDMSEILAGTSIPGGVYRSASIRLDFSNALVLLSGSDTPAAIYDKEGAVLDGVIDVPLRFEGAGYQVVSATKPVLFVFDLDLNSSAEVDVPGNSVEFEPVISCVNNPSDPNQLVAGGRFINANSGNGTIEIGIWNILTGEMLSTYNITTDSSTVFHVNGITYQGSDGVAAVNTLSPGSRVYAHGTMNAGFNNIKADFVAAGYGSPAGDQDCVHGHIIARDTGAGTDPILTVRGRCYERDLNRWTYNRTWTVNASYLNTRVVAWGSTEDYLDTDSLSVGQKIRAFGTLSGTVLDATVSGPGIIRALKTDMFGFAEGPVTDSVLTMEVTRIGLRPVGIFDFNVDGAPVADPLSYKVYTGVLDAGEITSDTPVRVRGFVAPISIPASTENFSVLTLVNHAQVGSHLVVKYLPAENPFLSLDETGFTLDTSGAEIAAVDNGFAGYIPLASSPAPGIVPAGEIGIYVVIMDGVVTSQLDFPTFEATLSQKLMEGALVRKVAALGQYNEAANVLSAGVVCVILQ